MQSTNGVAVVATQVLILPLLTQVRGVERLESNKQAAKAGIDGSLEQTGREHGIDGSGGLPEASHPAHAAEECRGEARSAEQVVVEKYRWRPGRRSISASAASTVCV